MDGYSTSRKIREQERFKNLPIIAMTANVMNGDRGKVLDAGMNDYVAKPINIDAMYNTMAKWISPGATSVSLVPPVSGDDGSPEELIMLELAKLPGIDIDAGLATSRGNAPFYRKLLSRFRDIHREFEPQFRAAPSDEDLETATRLVHSLKGDAGTIGATGIQRAAAALELACSEQADDIARRLEEMVRVLAPVLADLDTVLAATKDK